MWKQMYFLCPHPLFYLFIYFIDFAVWFAVFVYVIVMYVKIPQCNLRCLFMLLWWMSKSHSVISRDGIIKWSWILTHFTPSTKIIIHIQRHKHKHMHTFTHINVLTKSKSSTHIRAHALARSYTRTITHTRVLYIYLCIVHTVTHIHHILSRLLLVQHLRVSKSR